MASDGDCFLSSQLDVSDVPKIPLPISEGVVLHEDIKNILRALLINQNNLISNTEFLYNRLKEIS